MRVLHYLLTFDTHIVIYITLLLFVDCYIVYYPYMPLPSGYAFCATLLRGLLLVLPYPFAVHLPIPDCTCPVGLAVLPFVPSPLAAQHCHYPGCVRLVAFTTLPALPVTLRFTGSALYVGFRVGYLLPLQHCRCTGCTRFATFGLRLRFVTPPYVLVYLLQVAALLHAARTLLVALRLVVWLRVFTCVAAPCRCSHALRFADSCCVAGYCRTHAHAQFGLRCGCQLPALLPTLRFPVRARLPTPFAPVGLRLPRTVAAVATCVGYRCYRFCLGYLYPVTCPSCC